MLATLQTKTKAVEQQALQKAMRKQSILIYLYPYISIYLYIYIQGQGVTGTKKR